MNNKVLLLSTLGFLVAGCQYSLPAPDDSMSTECSVEPFDALARAAKPVSCRNVSINLSIAKGIMQDHGWIRDDAEFSRTFHKVQLKVVSERCIDGTPRIGLLPLPGCRYGVTWAEGTGDPGDPDNNFVHYGVEVNHDGGVLLHELMHVYDMTHGRYDVTTNHTDWDKLGYYRASDDFKAMVLPIME
jgi:hypothetical protein